MSAALHEEGIVLPGAVTVAEAAAWLGVSTKWIFRRVREGRLHVVGRDGRCLLIGTTPTTDLPTAVSTLPSPYMTPRVIELCKIVQCGSDAAVVTVTGPRAVRVLATVIPLDRQVLDGDGWRVSTTALPLIRSSMRLRGVAVEVVNEPRPPDRGSLGAAIASARFSGGRGSRSRPRCAPVGNTPTSAA